MPAGLTILPILFFIVWFGLAVTNLINPRWIWRVTQSWKAFREPPPSYFVMQRVWAAIMIVVGLVILSVNHIGFMR